MTPVGQGIAEEEKRTENLIFRVTPSEKKRFRDESSKRFMEQSELFRHMCSRMFDDADKIS